MTFIFSSKNRILFDLQKSNQQLKLSYSNRLCNLLYNKNDNKEASQFSLLERSKKVFHKSFKESSVNRARWGFRFDGNSKNHFRVAKAISTTSRIEQVLLIPFAINEIRKKKFFISLERRYLRTLGAFSFYPSIFKENHKALRTGNSLSRSRKENSVSLLTNLSQKLKQAIVLVKILRIHYLWPYVHRGRMSTITIFSPKITIWGFAFASSFLLLTVSTVFQKQEQKSSFFLFSRKQMPGLYLISQKSSWECFENIILKHLSRRKDTNEALIDSGYPIALQGFASLWSAEPMKEEQSCYNSFSKIGVADTCAKRIMPSLERDRLRSPSSTAKTSLLRKSYASSFRVAKKSLEIERYKTSEKYLERVDCYEDILYLYPSLTLSSQFAKNYTAIFSTIKKKSHVHDQEGEQSTSHTYVQSANHKSKEIKTKIERKEWIVQPWYQLHARIPPKEQVLLRSMPLAVMLPLNRYSERFSLRDDSIPSKISSSTRFNRRQKTDNPFSRGHKFDAHTCPLPLYERYSIRPQVSATQNIIKPTLKTKYVHAKNDLLKNLFYRFEPLSIEPEVFTRSLQDQDLLYDFSTRLPLLPAKQTSIYGREEKRKVAFSALSKKPFSQKLLFAFSSFSRCISRREITHTKDAKHMNTKSFTFFAERQLNERHSKERLVEKALSLLQTSNDVLDISQREKSKTLKLSLLGKEKAIDLSLFSFLQKVSFFKEPFLVTKSRDPSKAHGEYLEDRKVTFFYPLYQDKGNQSKNVGLQSFVRDKLYSSSASHEQAFASLSERDFAMPLQIGEKNAHQSSKERLFREQSSRLSSCVHTSLQFVSTRTAPLLGKKDTQHLSKQSCYTCFLPVLEKSCDRVSNRYLYKRNTISNRFMSGYQNPETNGLEVQESREKKKDFVSVARTSLPMLYKSTYAYVYAMMPCAHLRSRLAPHFRKDTRESRNITRYKYTRRKGRISFATQLSIKVPPALPFYRSIFKTSQFFSNINKINAFADAQVSQRKHSFDAHTCPKRIKPEVRATQNMESSTQNTAKALFSVEDSYPIANCFTSRKIKAKKEVLPSLLEREDQKSTSLFRMQSKERSFWPYSVRASKKIPYRTFFLNGVKEVEPIFEDVNKRFRVSPYLFRFKKALFKNYNDYLSWQKDTPAAIAIFPSIETEEDSFSLNSEMLPTIGIREAHQKEPLSLEKQKKEKNLSDFSKKIDEKASQISQNKDVSASDDEKREERRSSVSALTFHPDSQISEEEDSESSNTAEEGEKKKEITKESWLDQIREATRAIEKRKDLQILAYPPQKAVSLRDLHIEEGIVNSLLVTDRKHSFFGITNLFPKRLISEDQKQINSQIVRNDLYQRWISLTKNLKRNSYHTTLPFSNCVKSRSSISIEDLLIDGDRFLRDEHTYAKPISPEVRQSKLPSIKNGALNLSSSESTGKDTPSLLKITPRASLRKKSLEIFSLKALSNAVDKSNFEVACKDVHQTSKNGKHASLYEIESESRSLLRFEKPNKVENTVKRQHPVHTPNRRLRLRVPQSSIFSQNSNSTSWIDDIENQSHRWWQKRRLSSSLLGAPSKRYLAMPKITIQDWRKIIEWQLKTYLLEEEKRVESLLLKKDDFFLNLKKSSLEGSLPSDSRTPDEHDTTPSFPSPKVKGIAHTNRRFVSATQSKCMPKQLFKIKKIAIYLPWASLKKPIKKPFEWPVTGLSYRSSLQSQESPKQICNAQKKLSSPYTFLDGEIISYIKDNQVFDHSSYKSVIKKKKDYRYDANLKLHSFIQNKKGDSCFLSSISPHFKRSSCEASRSLSCAYQSSIFKRMICKAYKKRGTASLFKSTNSFYKPFLFEKITKKSHLALHACLLAIALKSFFNSLYRLLRKGMMAKLKDSSLSIVLLPIFWGKSSQKHHSSTFFQRKERLNQLASNEESVSSLSEIIWCLRNSCRGRVLPRGVVLIDTFSSESTPFLKAIAGEAKVPVIVQSLRALLFTQNHPQRHLEKILRLAQKQAPCILFLDDLDSIGQSRKGLLRGSTVESFPQNRILTHPPLTDDVMIRASKSKPLPLVNPLLHLHNLATNVHTGYVHLHLLSLRMHLRARASLARPKLRFSMPIKQSVQNEVNARIAQSAVLCGKEGERSASQGERSVIPVLKENEQSTMPYTCASAHNMHGQKGWQSAYVFRRVRSAGKKVSEAHPKDRKAYKRRGTRYTCSRINKREVKLLREAHPLQSRALYVSKRYFNQQKGSTCKTLYEDRFDFTSYGSGSGMHNFYPSSYLSSCPCTYVHGIARYYNIPLEITKVSRSESKSTIFPVRTGSRELRESVSLIREKSKWKTTEKEVLNSSQRSKISKLQSLRLKDSISLKSITSKFYRVKPKMRSLTLKSIFLSKVSKNCVWRYKRDRYLPRYKEILLCKSRSQTLLESKDNENDFFKTKNELLAEEELGENSTVIKQRRVDLMLRLLTVMDGISQLNGILIVTSSKNPSLLDPALLRPGRFEKLINLKLPSKKKRVEFLKAQLSKVGYKDCVPFEYFGAQTQNMSGTQIASAINHSALRALLQSTVHTPSTIEYGISYVNSDRISADNQQKELQNSLRSAAMPLVPVTNRRKITPFCACKSAYAHTYRKRISGEVSARMRTKHERQKFCGANPLQDNRYLQSMQIDKQTVFLKALVVHNAYKSFLKTVSFNDKTGEKKIRGLSHLRSIAVPSFLYCTSHKVVTRRQKLCESKPLYFYKAGETLGRLKSKVKITRCKSFYRCKYSLLSCYKESSLRFVKPLYQRYTCTKRIRRGLTDTYNMQSFLNSDNIYFISRKEVAAIDVKHRIPHYFLKRTSFFKTLLYLYSGQASLQLSLNKRCLFKKKAGFIDHMSSHLPSNDFRSTDGQREVSEYKRKRSRELQIVERYVATKFTLNKTSSKVFLYYNTVLHSFYTAFQNCDENRELLDFLADHLIRFKSLKVHEVTRIALFYLSR